MPATRPVTFGAFAPQGWKTELAGVEGAEAKWEKTVEVAVLAEELGYDSIWVDDHFHNVPVPAHEAVFDNPVEFADTCDVLARHCEAVGRDYDEIEKTWTSNLLVRETEAELRAAVDPETLGESWESWLAGNLVATPAQVIENVGRYVELGCMSFIPWRVDDPATDTLELVAAEVLPAIR